ncbi:hypothetical protein P153DRAFT_339139 [Dothidotthia symphoricarpi CBS 119687]|uniref:RRM domain-containing protein n=1 Tax=Dothidotthia symphoricarpi CBS 119687 TaxID=1392245 RepID=A0A6A6AF09_9PLEO|nr:uncharacterized protein P153DRAFT_339139 [Dothidotthia symphoricarpi CBS 119687]KAF2129883.1 hypothetical protein P153DRAFT_339139 [Dothidotthia symphoricarpi CBS 119687]
MRFSPSPPQEAEHIRHQQLTPESPRPQNNPSPSNIPILILDKQMDPVFNDSPHSHGASTPAQYASQSQPSSAFSTTPYYAEQASTAGYQNQNVGAQGSGGGVMPAGISQSAFGGGRMGAQTQDTSSIQTFSAQHQSRAPSSSDAQQPPGTDHHSAYPFAHDNAHAAQHAPALPAPGAHYQAASAGASVDIQALLDSLTPSANHAPSGQYAVPHMPTQSAHPQPNASASSLPAAPSLPARPPAQDKPATHPNYNPNDDIRSFHPHSQKPSNPQQEGNGKLQSLNVRGQDFSSAPRPSAQSPSTSGTFQRHAGQRSETPDDEDARWPPEINKKYEEFLDQERKFVTEGQWDQFPVGSRLFIGNLPSEKVTKRDVFHRFYRYGRLAQISIKQAYGFVQFLDAESCRQALQAQDRQTIRGKPMHLEISKPQRNTKKADPQNNGARRRSRSPDYTRGGPGPTRDGRYGGGQNSMSPRDRRFRDRDDYRPMRSPSPRGGPRGMRPRDRSRDRYDTRYRSRSRSPPRRYRSRSPRRDYAEDDLDGLPRRLPHEVPEIQVLVLNQGLPSDFIRYVEDSFRAQGLRCDVLIMSGRYPEPAIVRRQILEGVLAIVRLDTSSLVKGNVNVQVFDRRSGATNVQFNEYADLDLTTVSMLVNQAKQSQSQPVQPPAPTYGYNQYSQPPPAMFPPAAQPQPNLTNVLASLNPNALAQLLGAMSSQTTPIQTPQPAPAPAPSGLNVDIARLLAQVSQPPAQHPVQPLQPPQQQPPQTSGFAAQQLSNQFPGLAGLLAGQGQGQGQAGTAAPPPQQQQQTPGQNGAAPSVNVDMSEIMAQLQKYQR